MVRTHRSPAVQSLPMGLDEPAAFWEASPWRGSSAATTAAALCSTRPAPWSVSPGQSKVMFSKVTPISPMHSPVCHANATMTSMLLRRSLNAVAPSVCIPRPRPRSWSLTVWLSSACETFDATAVVIGAISSAPHTLGGRRESIEPSRCPDFVWETMVSQVLYRTPALAQLAHLICLPVRDSPSTRL